MSLCTCIRVSHYWARGPLRLRVTGHMCWVGACEAVGAAEAGEEVLESRGCWREVYIVHVHVEYRPA